MKILAFTCCLLGTILVANNTTYANPVDVVASLPYVDPYTGSYNADTKEDRVKIANKIKLSLSVFESYLPKINETDLKTIQEQELEYNNTKISDSNYWANMKAYYNNPNYDNYSLRKQVAILSENLNYVINSSNTSEEMSCWVNVSILLMDIVAWENINAMISHGDLPDIDLIPHVIKMDNLYKIFHHTGIDILEHVITPYIKSKK